MGTASAISATFSSLSEMNVGTLRSTAFRPEATDLTSDVSKFRIDKLADDSEKTVNIVAPKQKRISTK